MSLALITVNALIPDEADRVVVAESAMPHLRLKTAFQLAGVAYAAYLAWWLTRDGWPDCCPHPDLEDDE